VTVFGKLTQALKDGLRKTKDKLLGGLRAILPFGRDLDDALIDEMEETLYVADIGPKTVKKIVEAVRTEWRERRVKTTDECFAFLKRYVRGLLGTEAASLARAASGPTVIMIAGVNGSGKTTSIAKLAYRLKQEGTVLLAAADTFRAAAVDQLALWSERLGIKLVRQGQGSDPAAVAFDAIESAVAKGVDFLIIDTAGRLHTQENLMKELEKIKRVIKKRVPDAPHETLLVLDATTGQNAITQALEFGKILEITGIFLTKLDGTAKGGAVIGIRDQVGIPIKFIGVGEKMQDIEDFDPDAFVDALFEQPSEPSRR
jgi:fused signal recognition particle receptor